MEAVKEVTAVKLVAGWIGKMRPWDQRGKTKTGKIRTSARRGALGFHSSKVGNHISCLFSVVLIHGE